MRRGSGGWRGGSCGPAEASRGARAASRRRSRQRHTLLYALLPLPLSPAPIGTHPLALEIIRGSVTSIITMGALARTGEASAFVAVVALIMFESGGDEDGGGHGRGGLDKGISEHFPWAEVIALARSGLSTKARASVGSGTRI